MLSERLQVLISREQRRRLEEESRRTGASVGALVRHAIDAQLGSAATEERRRAVDAIAALGGVYLTPAELEAVIAEERERAGAIA
jgi:uncharacterized protein YcfJ